jgi:hypothetical protein
MMSLRRTVGISAGTRIFRCTLTADAPLPAVRDVDPMAIGTVDIRGGYMRLVSPIRIRDSRHEPHRAKLGLGAAFLCSLPSTLLSISDSQVVSDNRTRNVPPEQPLSLPLAVSSPGEQHRHPRRVQGILQQSYRRIRGSIHHKCQPRDIHHPVALTGRPHRRSSPSHALHLQPVHIKAIRRRYGAHQYKSVSSSPISERT